MKYKNWFLLVCGSNLSAVIRIEETKFLFYNHQYHIYCTLHIHTICPSFVMLTAVAFKIYDIDKDGFIGNGELFQVLKTMVGNNLTEKQLQQIVDKTILYADKDGDGKISFDEFCSVSLIS